MLDGNPRESGSEFQRTLPEYTWLDFEISVLKCLDWFREHFAIREGGTFPDRTFAPQNSFVQFKSFFEGKNGYEITV